MCVCVCDVCVCVCVCHIHRWASACKEGFSCEVWHAHTLKTGKGDGKVLTRRRQPRSSALAFTAGLVLHPARIRSLSCSIECVLFNRSRLASRAHSLTLLPSRSRVPLLSCSLARGLFPSGILHPNPTLVSCLLARLCFSHTHSLACTCARALACVHMRARALACVHMRARARTHTRTRT